MPLETNMAWFGVLALDQFRDRLREYPKFCKEVMKIPHLKEGKNKYFESSQSQINLDLLTKVRKENNLLQSRILFAVTFQGVPFHLLKWVFFGRASKPPFDNEFAPIIYPRFPPRPDNFPPESNTQVCYPHFQNGNYSHTLKYPLLFHGQYVKEIGLNWVT